MMKLVCAISLVAAFVAGTFAQTTNRKYEVTFFGSPPGGQKIWNLPRSVAADGKGSIFVFRGSDPPVLTILKNGKVVDVIGFLQARPHNIAIDPATGVLYLADPPTPMMAGGIFNATPRNAAPARNTTAGSVDRTAERMQGGAVEQATSE